RADRSPFGIGGTQRGAPILEMTVGDELGGQDSGRLVGVDGEDACARGDQARYVVERPGVVGAAPGCARVSEARGSSERKQGFGNPRWAFLFDHGSVCRDVDAGTLKRRRMS